MATYNYTVTASGNSYYLWNGHGLVDAQNPDLFFRAGDSVTITKASSGHPMRITNDASPSVGIINESGGQIVVNPVSQGSFTYFCTSHPSAMIGAITVSAAYTNEGPEDGYGTGPLIGHDAGPLSMNEIRTKINEIITKGGIGGTPGTGGGSISVSQNAPSSPSDGDLWWDEDTASLYVYFAERSAWIQTNGGVGGGGNFSTGWVSQDASGTNVANNAVLTFMHNLGTADLVAKVYMAKDANGTDARETGQDTLLADYRAGLFSERGAFIDSITSTTVDVRLLQDGWIVYDSTGNSGGSWGTTYTHIKVVISASGGGGGTPAGSNGEIQFNDNGAFGTAQDLKYEGGSLTTPSLIVGSDNTASGNEGGEIALAGAPNGTIAGYPRIDVYQNKIRFFEGGPPYKGAYVDLSECDPFENGTGTNLLAGGGASVTTSASVPASPSDGDLWFNTTQAELYVYVDAESAWIQTNSGGGSGGGGGAEWLVIPGGSAYQESNAKTLQIENYNPNTDLIFFGFSGTQIPGDGSQIQLYQNQVAARGQSNGYVFARMTSTGLISVWTNAVREQIISDTYILRLNSSGSGGGGPRAYLAFDGTSSNLTGSITNSFNVSSITDNGTGNYTVAFTNPVVNQVISITSDFGSLNAPMDPSYEILNSNQVRIKIGESESVWPTYAADLPHISLIVF